MCVCVGGGGGNTFGFTVEGQASSIVSREVVGWWMLDLARATAGCKFITSQ